MPEWRRTESLRVWALIKPDGHVLADSSFQSEDDVWQVGLGWPSPGEIEDAKKKGYRAARVAIITTE